VTRQSGVDATYHRNTPCQITAARCNVSDAEDFSQSGMRPAALPLPSLSSCSSRTPCLQPHAGDIMNAPPVLSPTPLERANHLTVLADRERIARDLNDHVIQRIFAVGLDLQGTIARSRSSEITARLNRSVADLQTVIEDICTTVFELHVTGKPRVGFRQRIQAAVADLTENRDIATTLRMSGPMSVIGHDLDGLVGLLAHSLPR
jgi:hypothetical protein